MYLKLEENSNVWKKTACTTMSHETQFVSLPIHIHKSMETEMISLLKSLIHPLDTIFFFKHKRTVLERKIKICLNWLHCFLMSSTWLVQVIMEFVIVIWFILIFFRRCNTDLTCNNIRINYDFYKNNISLIYCINIYKDLSIFRFLRWLFCVILFGAANKNN